MNTLKLFLLFPKNLFSEEDRFIFSEVCVHVGAPDVFALSPGCVCVCLFPQTPSRSTTELSGSAFHFNCSGRSLAGPRGSSQALASLRSIAFFCVHICLYTWDGEGGGVDNLAAHHSCEGKYIKLCRQLVKQSLTGAINCIGPCKHDSLSAKRCLPGAPLLWNVKGSIHAVPVPLLVQSTPGKHELALP